MNEWQPIETAPKDGTELLLYGTDEDGYYKLAYGSWRTERGQGWVTLVDSDTEKRKVLQTTEYNYWEPSYGWRNSIYPTHWMILPRPVSTSEG